MITRSARLFASLAAFAALLPLAGTAAAQTWPPERVDSPEVRSEFEQPVAWPKPEADSSTQTFLGIRHNDTDGTVVGMGLRPGSYPSFLLELEVVPPGYGPIADKLEATPAPTLPSDNPKLRTLHKLTLRYHF